MSENKKNEDTITKKYSEPVFRSSLTENDPEQEDDEDEYEYVTPHYGRNAVLLVIFSMIAGAVIMYFLTGQQLKETIRNDYLKQGYILTADATATPADIAAGKTAYVNGVKITGNYVELDTSAATAKASDILKGYTAYVNGVKITGAITSFAPKTFYQPDRNAITVAKKGTYLSDSVIIQGDEDLVAKNIKAGVTIFGVKGTYSSD